MDTLIENPLARADGPPSAKRQRTSPSDAPSPGLTPNPAPGPGPQKPSVEDAKPKDDAAVTREPPKFKMKRTGTNGLPPGHSVPHALSPHYASTIAKLSTSSSVPTSAKPDKLAAGTAKDKHVQEDSNTPKIVLKPLPNGLEGHSPAPGSSQSATISSPRQRSAPSRAPEMVNTASPQSIAMKRKWASGRMDGVAQKAAQTRRLNAERRMSVMTLSDNSTPEPAAPSPTPAAAVANKPSLADYYRQRAGKAATTPSTDSFTPEVVSDITSPQRNNAKVARDGVTGKRPIILTLKRPAKKAPEPSTPQVAGTHFDFSLSGRPYDMVLNENGRLVHGFGALFPDGYAPLPGPDGRGYRWICPVRHCTHERSYLKSHAKHFVKDHQTCLLNDNGDGTFVVVGYKAGQNAPVVVSRDPKLKGRTSLKVTTAVAAAVVEGPGTPKDSRSATHASADTSGSSEREKDNDADGLFITTPSGRPYMMYPDTGGRTSGVPVPDGYERLVSSAKTPWVCPVQTCLSSWASQNGLSIHFAKVHGGCTFNDNLDGTLSVLGRRDDDARFRHVQGWGHKDALVVRQSRMSRADTLAALGDMVERQTSMDVRAALNHTSGHVPPSPQVNASVTSDVVQLPASQPRVHYLTTATTAHPVENLSGGALEIWNYIRPYLTQFTECPDSSWIPELLKLPKVRDIVWNDTYIANNGFKDKVSRDVATMIMQVTGEIPPKTCSRCREGSKAPYGECVVISSQAPIEARFAFSACASCIYNGQGTYCTLKFWGKKRAQEPAAIGGSETATQETEADRERPSMSGTPGSQPQVNTEGQSLVRRSERVQVKEAIIRSGPENSPFSARGASPDAPFIPNEVTPAAEPAPPPQRVLRASNSRPKQQKEVEPNYTDGMQIEDWELAPGRLQSTAPPEDGEPAEYIAFSKAYLSTNQSVRVSQDASFRIDVVTSGSSLRWAATPDRMRICSVGAGKVKVRIQGEEEFDLGPHGMFRLLPGRSCVVLNRLYGNAVLHVTEVSDYS